MTEKKVISGEYLMNNFKDLAGGHLVFQFQYF